MQRTKGNGRGGARGTETRREPPQAQEVEVSARGDRLSLRAQLADRLITKHRPNNWDEVVGQGVVVDSLSDAIAKRKSQAYLLIGPSGVGKTTLAYIAATQLGCEAHELIEVDAATETGIDNVRLIQEQLGYMPLNSSTKVVLMDEVQALSKSAWQSLLKILEAPPSWVYWFLCTTEGRKVPETVKTRCFSYELKPVGTRELIELLCYIAKAERWDIDPQVIALCAQEASGSPRQAIVNLGVCSTARNLGEAGQLLHSAAEDPLAVDLARMLLKGAAWKDIQYLIRDMAEANLDPESVRHVVRAYLTKVALNEKHEAKSAQIITMLEEFSVPFPRDGMTPVLLACAKALLSE